ncbi:unnamed protein product, partial [Choristocarpus tenellus]
EFSHHEISVTVFETSKYGGALLTESVPSVKKDCRKSSHASSDSSSDDSSNGSSDDSSNGSSEDSSNGSSDESSDDSQDMDSCPLDGRGTVVVDTSTKLQEILGFGGAFTDAATINLNKLPPSVQTKVMDAYFGPTGIEYSIGRIPLDSCDFSVEQYNFDDHPGDYNLLKFDNNITMETYQRIPMIKEAIIREENLNLFTSPWSPPAWMKVPRDGEQSMIKSAWPQGLLDDPRVKEAWALYFSKFISAYSQHGIDLWGLTVQNEPENPGPWEACVFNASFEVS